MAIDTTELNINSSGKNAENKTDLPRSAYDYVQLIPIAEFDEKNPLPVLDLPFPEDAFWTRSIILNSILDTKGVAKKDINRKVANKIRKDFQFMKQVDARQNNRNSEELDSQRWEFTEEVSDYTHNLLELYLQGKIELVPIDPIKKTLIN